MKPTCLTVFAVLLLASVSAGAVELYEIPAKGSVQQARLFEAGVDVLGPSSTGQLLVAARPEHLGVLSTWGRQPRRVVLDHPTGLSRRLDGVYADYHTYAETQAVLASLAATHPALCELQSMGTSYEGRDIPVLRITNLAPARRADGKPEVMIFGNLHARELMSVEIPLRFAQYLLENYATDPEVAALVDTRDIYIAPMLNPDGHVFVENDTSNPWWEWWRKNRRPNGDGTIGVDLNRNFGYEWGRDDVGSSPNTESLVYRGPAPFSEPETAALEAFIASRDFVMVLSYHSYAEVLIYPWAYDQLFTVDHELYRSLGERLTAENGYASGNVAEGILYTVNGGSDDWGYGESTAKNSYLAFTVEVNNANQGGFGPEDVWIQPTFDLMLPMNLRFLELAVEPRSVLGPLAPVLASAPAFAGGTLSLSWSGDDPFDPNPVAGYEVEEFLDLGGSLDAADSDTGLWDVDGFTISPTAFAGAGSWYSGQGDDLQRALTTNVPYVVDTATQEFRCRMRYEIEDDYDYAYVLVSDDGGLIWTTVPGNITTDDDPHGVNRGNGITGSTGGAWVEAVFDLADYVGQTLDLQIVYITDGSVQGAGIWIDELTPVPTAAGRRTVVNDHPTNAFDVAIDTAARYTYRVRASDAAGDQSRWSNLVTYALDPATAVVDATPTISHLRRNVPNPFNPRTTIEFGVGGASGGDAAVRLAIFDIRGRRVRTLIRDRRVAGVHRVVWDGRDDAGRDVASGGYLARLWIDDQAVSVRRMTLVR